MARIIFPLWVAVRNFGRIPTSLQFIGIFSFGGSELVYLMSGNKLRPTMISDYFLGELASCGVCWFVEMRPSKERDLRIISDQGILDFFRGTSTRHGRRHLVLDNVQNCSAVVARLLKVSYL